MSWPVWTTSTQSSRTWSLRLNTRSAMAVKVDSPIRFHGQISADSSSVDETEGRTDGHGRGFRRLPNSFDILLHPQGLLSCAHEGALILNVPYSFGQTHDLQLIDAHDDPKRASAPFLLMGLLANYDKFETASNAYRTRFGDFVNDATMARITDCIGTTATLLRDRYVALSDDTPAGWSLGGTLSYVGLGSLAGAKPALPSLTEEEQKIGLGQQ